MKPAAYFDLQNYNQRGSRRCTETCIALCPSLKPGEVKARWCSAAPSPQQPASCTQPAVEKHRHGRPDAVMQTGWIRTGKQGDLKEELHTISAELQKKRRFESDLSQLSCLRNPASGPSDSRASDQLTSCVALVSPRDRDKLPFFRRFHFLWQTRPRHLGCLCDALLIFCGLSFPKELTALDQIKNNLSI